MTSRCEHDLHIPLGSIVHCAKNLRWVFIGWSMNTVGRLPVFVREITGQGLTYPPWYYHCAATETLIKKFPDAERFRRAPDLHP